jgi:hypothetical protein
MAPALLFVSTLRSRNPLRSRHHPRPAVHVDDLPNDLNDIDILRVTNAQGCVMCVGMNRVSISEACGINDWLMNL